MICSRRCFRSSSFSIGFAVTVCLTISISSASATCGSTPKLRVIEDPKSGQIIIREDEHPVLRYNYKQVPLPAGYLEKVPASARKYAVPRSNYIHPLYGPDGEELTEDWSGDHPHHRGIYWAWPEVDFGKQRGDLHALQRVFARPTGDVKLESNEKFARIEAVNLWKWEDKTPIVREVTTIVAHRAGKHGRYIDLKFQFTALVDGVKLARRGTKAYGGLNMRLSAIKDMKLIHHEDPTTANPRRAWSDSIGIRSGGTKAVGLAVFEKTTNPDYPGEYVEYPHLPWFQPTFPKSGTRFELKKGKPLVLEYRLWIRRGKSFSEKEYDRRWRELNAVPATSSLKTFSRETK